MHKLRVGYILDDVDQNGLFLDLIERSRNAKNYSIESLIIQKNLRTESTGVFSKSLNLLQTQGVVNLVRRILFGVINRIERPILKRNPRYANFFTSHAIDSININKIYVTPQISKSGFVYRYADADLDAIRALNLDVLIRGGSGILRGKILTVCPYGVLSFHHADNDEIRGMPAAFWEVLNRDPSTGFIIQQLSEELDGGAVYFKGAVPTSWFFNLNMVRLYQKTNVFMHLLLEQLGQTGSLPTPHSKKPYSKPLYSIPSIPNIIRYFVKTGLHAIAKAQRKVQGQSFRWSVAYQFVDHWKSAVLWKSTIIQNPPNRFFADPFVVFRNGRHICYVEDYDYSTSLGTITAIEINRDKHTELGKVLVEDFHLSYPFLFEEAGELYMCPETHQARQIRIYKCTDFPMRWELHKVIMSDISTVDTNLFKFNGKWWMLTNIDSSDSAEQCSELHLFYADTFDSTEWTRHPLNPVIFDSLKARNGGLLFDGADIYRVFQVQGFDLYGAAMGVAKITALTTQTYAEELYCSITPDYFKKLRGNHTYSFDHGLMVLDFVRVEKNTV